MAFCEGIWWVCDSNLWTFHGGANNINEDKMPASDNLLERTDFQVLILVIYHLPTNPFNKMLMQNSSDEMYKIVLHFRSRSPVHVFAFLSPSFSPVLDRFDFPGECM